MQVNDVVQAQAGLLSLSDLTTCLKSDCLAALFLFNQVKTLASSYTSGKYLNLVLTENMGVVVASESLFSLLNDIAVFIRDSYKRMKLWGGTSDKTRQDTPTAWCNR